MARISFSGVVATTLVMSTTILAQSIQLTLPTNPPATLSETVSRTFTMDLPPLSNDIPSTTSVSVCPTIVSTTNICSECVTIACVASLTVTAPCGCETPAATIFRDHPCGIGCAGLEGCQTESVVVLPTDCSSSSGGSGASSTTGTASETTTGSPTETEVSSSVSTLPPTSTTSTAAAARLAPFRLW
ncbi:hypothetical protein V8F20_004752 [Naviculisporaceae sp. PSN 640]